MTEVRVELMGPIRRPAGLESGDVVEIDEGLTLDDLLAQLGFSGEERKRLRLSTEGQGLRRSRRIGKLERITIFLPLGGG